MRHLILVVLFLFPLSVNAVTVVRVRRQITNKQVNARSSREVQSMKMQAGLYPLRSDSNDLSAPVFMSEAWGNVPDYQEYKTIGKYKHRQVIAAIYLGESSYGKNDVCRSRGLANGFGYDEHPGHSPTCFDSFDTVVHLVNDWIEDKVQKGWSYAKMGCYYITGRAVEECETSYKLKSIEL